jgi:hypothetical protein
MYRNNKVLSRSHKEAARVAPVPSFPKGHVRTNVPVHLGFKPSTVVCVHWDQCLDAKTSGLKWSGPQLPASVTFCPLCHSWALCSEVSHSGKALQHLATSSRPQSSQRLSNFLIPQKPPGIRGKSVISHQTYVTVDPNTCHLLFCSSRKVPRVH